MTIYAALPALSYRGPSPCSMPSSELFLGQQHCWLNPLLSQHAQHSPGLPRVPISGCSSQPRKGSHGDISYHKGRAGSPYPSSLRSGGCGPNPKGICAQCPGLHAHPPGSSFGGCSGFQGEASPGWFRPTQPGVCSGGAGWEGAVANKSRTGAAQHCECGFNLSANVLH